MPNTAAMEPRPNPSTDPHLDPRFDPRSVGQPKIIISGLGRTGYRIFCLLRQQGAAVVGISDRPIPEDSDRILVGNPQTTATLIAAGIRTAQTLILAGSRDSENLAILMQAKILNPKIRIINRLFNSNLGRRLDRTLSAHVSMSVSSLAAPVFAFAALGSRAIGQLQLFDRTWPIHEELIHEGHPWRGRPLRDLWDDLNTLSIYYLPATGRDRADADLVSAVLGGRTLEVGDRLIVATQPNVRKTHRTLRQRFNRAVAWWRPFQHYGRSAAVALGLLLLAIALSCATYLSMGANISPVDALYFSVGMITGAGGQEQVAEQAPDAIKVLTAVMMIIGAGLIGICYALLNDFVLGTRFRQFWNVARVPQSHHYAICGLGGVGIRIAQVLRDRGCDVVVIERDSNNRFLATAQALNIPVILADATMEVSLKAANVHRASALLAVTSDDMMNLEIALSARAIAPHLPTIVRNEDPRSALMVHQVFEFDSVLSPIDLAAPTFAAAAIGGRILGNGMTADILWVALGTLITPRHPFCGQQVQDVAREADFVPLYLETSDGTLHGWDLLEARLQLGHVLYLSIPAKRLDTLWRVAPDRVMDLSKGKHF
ncbi:MAG: NAD-binding protein [Cyanobacteria bacterium]|nr:NAD-binding protein [Cyanobacteriota bacterium]